MPNDSKRAHLQRRHTSLTNERASWDAHYKDLSAFILPRRGRFLGQKYEHNRGSKKNDSIVDATATMAVGVAASGMKSGLANKAARWFVLGTPDAALQEWGPVKDWLWMAERLLYDVFARSNFYDSLTTIFEELVTFGTAALNIEEDEQDVIRCYPYTCGSYTLALDSSLRPDTLYRTVIFTAAQLVHKFGEDNVSDAIKTGWEAGSTETLHEIIHLIEPNDKRIEGKVDAKNKAWRSVYFDPQDDEDNFLREGGYDEFPVAAPRWWVTANDVYGTSPGMVALPDVRQLQKDVRRKGKNIEMIVNPPMVGPTSLKTQRVSSVPGDVTFVDTQSQGQKFEPAWIANPNIQPQIENIRETQQRIERAFFVDIFKMIASRISPQMTATQVVELAKEKMILLGPVVERAENELLDKAITRTLNIALAAQLLPPPPPELFGTGYDVQYISLLALAQRESGAYGIQDTAAFVAGMAEVWPDSVTKFNSRQAVDEFARMNGVPPGVIRTDEEVAEMDKAAAQQAQQMQAMEMAERAAQTGKTMSETQVGEGNALEALAGAGQ